MRYTLLAVVAGLSFVGCQPPPQQIQQAPPVIVQPQYPQYPVYPAVIDRRVGQPVIIDRRPGVIVEPYRPYRPYYPGGIHVDVPIRSICSPHHHCGKCEDCKKNGWTEEVQK